MSPEREILRQKRVKLHAELILKGLTLRQAAKRTGYSKTCVHLDVTVQLKYYYPDLVDEVKEKLAYQLSQRHIKGGQSTKLKYLKIKQQTN